MHVLIFFIILLVLVLVHELGHFIAAKKNGVLVEEFGIGFPPKLFGFKKGETLYTFNLIPLGGFVKVYGEEYHEEESNIHPELKNRAFINKKPWQKTVIIVSGIIGNFIFGWILISFLFTQGVPVPANHVIVEQVQSGSPAEEALIKPKDIISKVEIDKKTISIKTSNDLIDLSKKHSGKQIKLFITRNNKPVETAITPRLKPTPGQGPLGIVITSFVEKKYAWYEAPFYGVTHAFFITKSIVTELYKSLSLLLMFKSPNVDVAGPIGIAQFTGQAFKSGFGALIELTALLSLNLAVINILPFPALDGGRLMFVFYEWITKKRVNKTFERYTNLAGIAILLTLALFISVNDIVKLFK